MYAKSKVDLQYPVSFTAEAAGAHGRGPCMAMPALLTTDSIVGPKMDSSLGRGPNIQSPDAAPNQMIDLDNSACSSLENIACVWSSTYTTTKGDDSDS